MNDFTIAISKEDVYLEVAQTTSYTGAKMSHDPDAYDRVFTSREDRSQLERFWNEASAALAEALREFLAGDDYDKEGLRLSLSLSVAFDNALQAAVERDAFSYMVSYITFKWFAIANPKDAPQYADQAAALLEAIRRKVYHRRRPARPPRSKDSPGIIDPVGPDLPVVDPDPGPQPIDKVLPGGDDAL